MPGLALAGTTKRAAAAAVNISLDDGKKILLTADNQIIGGGYSSLSRFKKVD